MNLKQLAEEVNKQANESGWWEEHDYETLLITSKMFLIVSEVVEALEEVRKFGSEAMGLYGKYYDDKGKPEGAAIELADALIRILDLAEEYGFDLGVLADEKAAYNKTRSKHHGGKKL